jgi:hypothetical protein
LKKIKKIMIVLFHRNKKKIILEIGLKTSVISKVDSRCQKIGKSVSNHFWKMQTNFGDQLSRGTNCLGDHLSMGTK